MTTTHDRTPEDVIWQALRLPEDGAQQLTDVQQASLNRRTDTIMRALTQAGFKITDMLAAHADKVFTREQVETAWNAGADLVLQDDDLQLGGRDTDLVNLVCNAIGTCLDHPETDSLETVILANYDPETDLLEDEEENAKLSDEDIRAACVKTVKGWINQ
jgi:hypothetical protein